MAGEDSRTKRLPDVGVRSAGPNPTMVGAAIVVAIAVYNVLQNLILPSWAYMPLNLAMTFGVVYAARWVGLTSRDLGIERSRLRYGLLAGIAVAVPALVVIAIVVALPAARPIFNDARVVDVGFLGAMYETLLRIPLGTALFEEVLFRGLVLGFLMRSTTVVRAVVWSSLLFGLWHVLPTLAALDLFQAGEIRRAGTSESVLAVAAGVALTMAYGMVMCGLRLHTKSLATPITVHAAVNSFVYGSFFLLAATT